MYNICILFKDKLQYPFLVLLITLNYSHAFLQGYFGI